VDHLTMTSKTPVALLLLVAAAAAADKPDLAASLRACSAESDAAKRLACFDAAAAALPAAPTPKTLEQRFGYRGEVAKDELQREREAEPRVEEIRSRVTAVNHRPMTPMIVTLANGQVWAQRAVDSRFDVAVGEEVTVKAAALGSFLLVSPRGGSTRVSRVK
jgi:hypothetical protein